MENKLNNNFLDNKQKQKFHKLNNSSLTTNFDNIESHSPLQWVKSKLFNYQLFNKVIVNILANLQSN